MATPAEQHGELVKHAAREAKRNRRRVRLERRAEVHAGDVGAERQPDRLDDDGEEGHEGVTAVAMSRRRAVQVWADQVVGQREENVADKGGKAGWRPPLVAEQLAVLDQEAHDEAATDVGPQRGKYAGRAGVVRQVREADAREGAEEGEEDEVGERVELRGQARDLIGLLGLFFGRGLLLLLLCFAASNVVERVAGRGHLVEVLILVGDVVGRVGGIRLCRD
ncbi:hypothetical protein BM221_004813 [Beauveria bassiana]|uniref:Uncharacterized protein n=1 Tax=Beauveria bassiana TaxID=176275 RepID=A0A2N6NSB2_BEABA|nr:hypothetical protein BM221_004813 [Beauveria bassiana]